MSCIYLLSYDCVITYLLCRYINTLQDRFIHLDALGDELLKYLGVIGGTEEE
jgi:hypothetical protein